MLPPHSSQKKVPKSLWSDFGVANDGARDGEESSNALHAKLTDTRNKWQGMESDVVFSGLESGVCSDRRSGVDVEIGKTVFSDEVEEGTPEIGRESRR